MSDCNFKPVLSAKIGIYQKCWKCGLSADAVMASEDSSDECRAAAGAFSNAEPFQKQQELPELQETRSRKRGRSKRQDTFGTG